MSNRILDLLHEGRLGRGTYATTDEQGRQILCLLTALTGDPETRPDTCPASVAPTWIAHLAPWWCDFGTQARWRDLMQQIGELSPRFGELVGATGRRALAGCQLVTLRVALRRAGEARPIAERVITLWERVLRGDEPTADEWEASEEASRAVSWAASRAALWASRAASRTALWASRAASRAALWASRAAVSEAEAAEETADEIIQGHITAIRVALGAVDGGTA